MRITDILEQGQYPLPIRPSSDNVDDVIDANFNRGKVYGHEIVPIHNLNGGTRQDDPREQVRVGNLARQMSGPGGYVSRLLVDPDGNVVEGQHRLDALRMLGHSHAPITRIGEITHGFPVEAMEQAVEQASNLHWQQVNQIVADVAEMVRECGTPQKVRDEYEFPRGWEPAFEAALHAIETAQA